MHIIHSQSVIAERWQAFFRSQSLDNSESDGTVVFSPILKEDGFTFDWDRCESVFEDLRRGAPKRVILISSAATYGAGHRHPRFIDEARIDMRKIDDFYAGQWRRFEETGRALKQSSSAISLLILRPCLTLLEGGDDWFNQALRMKVWFLPIGYDVSVQLLAESDFLQALALSVKSQQQGAFNVAPLQSIKWSRIAKTIGVKVLPGIQIAGFTEARWTRPKASFPAVEIAQYVSCCWTANPELIRDQLEFEAEFTSQEALVKQHALSLKDEEQDADPFGLSIPFVINRFWHRLVARYYWRVEVNGLEHLPKAGKGILFGPHRGFMPYDGVMMVYLLTTRLRRTPRFLVHTCLLKMPMLSRYIATIGGIPACRENANWVLDQNEILAVFPEGIQATFTEFSKSSELASFGRADFVKWALIHRAPLYPFVIVGAAETYPILRKLKWRWWKKTFEWPAFPITPTFPWFPVPLPTKWRIEFLPPINIHEKYPAETAEDSKAVRRIGAELRAQLQLDWDKLRAKRRGWFR